MDRWILTILLNIDQLANALLGGGRDETISSRLGRLKRRHGGTIPWSWPVSKIVDWGLDKIDPNHSIDAIEEDEGGDALVDKD